MQIHGPSESIATIPVERYTSGTVVMRLPCKVVLLIESAADCDRLMIAAAQARELLTGGSLQDLAAAQASPANPYTALSAAAVAQDVEPCSCAFRHQLAEASIPAADIDKLSPPCPHHPTGHLPQHTGGEPGCTYGGCTDHAHDAGVTPVSGACWADPLTRAERRVLREKLARACKRSYAASRFVVARDPQAADIEAMKALTIISVEASDLHLDVTERAEVATS